MSHQEKSLTELEAQAKEEKPSVENEERTKLREALANTRRIPWRMSGLAMTLRPGLITIVLFIILWIGSLAGVQQQPGAYSYLKYFWTGKPVPWEWTGKFGHTHIELLYPPVDGYGFFIPFAIFAALFLIWIALMFLGRAQGKKNYEAEKRWVASLPFPVLNYPEVVGTYDSNAFVIAIFYLKENAPLEDRMTRVASGLCEEVDYRRRDANEKIVQDWISMHFESDNFFVGKKNAYKFYKTFHQVVAALAKEYEIVRVKASN